MRGSSAQNRRLAVGGERERAAPCPSGGAPAASPPGPDHGVEEQLVVVLAVHPRLVGDGRRAEQREQLAGRGRCRRGTAARAPARDRRRGSASRSAGAAAGRSYTGTVAEALDRARRRSAARSDDTHGRRRRRAAPAGSRPARRPRRTGRRTRGSAPVSVTRPTTVARISHRAQRSSTASRFVGRDDGEHPLLALRRHHLDRRSCPARAWARARRRRPCPRRSWPRSPTPRTRCRRRRGPARRRRGRRRAARGTPR